MTFYLDENSENKNLNKKFTISCECILHKSILWNVYKECVYAYIGKKL